MSREHVSHGDIAHFADERVNLKRDDSSELRRQGRMLRDRLDEYVADHEHFEVRKMLISGSVAKGTALKSVSDLDIACYVSSASAPEEIEELIEWLAERLQKAFANFKPEQITRKMYSVGVRFTGTANEFDIVPILYDEDPQWRGFLVSQETGEKLMTSIPMHLDFLRKRKDANKLHLAQVIRLVKFWAKLRKNEDEGFRFKSFMIELIACHLADRGTRMDDYIEAMAKFFNFMITDEFKTAIAFADYYDPKTCKVGKDPIRIWDPVNCENNVADLYSDLHKQALLSAAMEAGDAVDSAIHAVSKGDTVRYWQKIFGPSFGV